MAKRNRCQLYLVRNFSQNKKDNFPNKKLLYAYLKFGTSLLGIILISIFITIWSLTTRKDINGTAVAPVEESFADFLSDSNTLNDHSHLWNRLQSEMQCCGVHGITDYIKTSIPWSCCRRPEDPSDPRCLASYQRGCLFALTDETRQRLLYVSVAALIFALVQVCLFIPCLNFLLIIKSSLYCFSAYFLKLNKKTRYGKGSQKIKL